MDFSAWVHADKWNYGSCLTYKFPFDFEPKWILFEAKSERILSVYSDPAYIHIYIYERRLRRFVECYLCIYLYIYT